MKKLIVALVVALLGGFLFYKSLDLGHTVKEMNKLGYGNRKKTATSEKTQPEATASVKPSEEADPKTAVPVVTANEKAAPPPLTDYQKQKLEFNAEAFQKLIAETSQQIPKKSALAKLSAAQAHHTPKALLVAGQKLGEVAEFLDKNSDLAQDAFVFYESCAGGIDNPDSVRALCYSNYHKIAVAKKYPEKRDLVSAKIKSMSKNLIGL